MLGRGRTQKSSVMTRAAKVIWLALATIIVGTFMVHAAWGAEDTPPSHAELALLARVNALVLQIELQEVVARRTIDHHTALFQQLMKLQMRRIMGEK